MPGPLARGVLLFLTVVGVACAARESAKAPQSVRGGPPPPPPEVVQEKAVMPGEARPVDRARIAEDFAAAQPLAAEQAERLVAERRRVEIQQRAERERRSAPRARPPAAAPDEAGAEAADDEVVTEADVTTAPVRAGADEDLSADAPATIAPPRPEPEPAPARALDLAVKAQPRSATGSRSAEGRVGSVTSKRADKAKEAKRPAKGAASVSAPEAVEKRASRSAADRTPDTKALNEYRTQLRSEANDLADASDPSGNKDLEFGGKLRGPRLSVASGEAKNNGALWVKDAVGGAEALAPRALRVVSHVQGARVRTVLDFVFENPAAERREGTFHIELPPDATPAGFTVFDGAIRAGKAKRRLLPTLPAGFVGPDAGGRLAPQRSRGAPNWSTRRTARVVEATRARAAQDEALRNDASGSTLQWGGGQSFTAQVFPIEAQSLKRVVVAYESPLPLAGDRVTYRLPEAPGGAHWAATVFVDDGHGELVGIPPSAETRRVKGWTRVDLGAAKAGAQLELKVGAAQAVLRSSAPKGLGGDTFYARLAPDVPATPGRATGRAIFVVDTSASESPAKAARRAELLEALLTSDPTLKRYAILLFDVRARWLHDVGYRANTARNRAASLAELRKVYFEGATSLDAAAAALQAQRAWAVDGEDTTVFLLTDGQITWGEPNPARILARHSALSDARVIAYRFGSDPGRAEALTHFARRSGGQVVSVAGGSGIPAAAQAHLRGGATLLDVTVEGAPTADLAVLGDPTTLHPGQVLTVAGRLPEGGAASLVVRYLVDGATRTVRTPLGRGGAQDRLAASGWADVYATQLAAARDPRFDPLLVAMGRRFSLGNRKASFVVGAPGGAEVGAAVDVADLLGEARRAREGSRRTAEGLGTDDLPAEVQAVLTELRQRSDRPATGSPLVHAPWAGGSPRLAAEAAYRAARAQAPGDLRTYEQIARTRALAGDTAGALRALSTPVERSEVDPAALRTVGYALLALGQPEAAAEVLAKLRRQRRFEAPAFLEEALALEAAGRLGAAGLRYERVLAGAFGARTARAHRAAASAYADLLAEVSGPASKARRRALAVSFSDVVALEPATLRVSAHWSDALADVDLWVYEPDGARCSVDAPRPAGGGRLLLDAREGLGPELYEAGRARAGAYDALVHYRRGAAARGRPPVGLLMVVDRRDRGVRTRRFSTRLLTKPGAVLLLRTERF